MAFSFYFIFTLLISFVFFLRVENNKLGVILLFIMFYLVAFRGENVGHDTIKYLDISYITNWAEEADISSFKFDDLGAKVELLSGLLFKFVAQFGISPRFVLIFYSAIMVLFIYLSCERFKTRIPYVAYFFVLFGFYFYSMSAARQFAAVPVVLYAMSFLQDKGFNKKQFLFWILFATAIHSFSVICLPLYFIDRLPKRNELPIIIYILSLLLVLVKIDFINHLSFLISVDKVSDYMNADSTQTFSLVRVVGYWIEISVFIFFFFRKKQLDRLITGSNDYYVIDKLYLVSILLYAFFFHYDGLIGRARYDFCIIQCVFLANYFEKRHLTTSKDVVAFLCLLIIRLMKNDAFVDALESSYYLA